MPEIEPHHAYTVVVIRTDHTNDAAWTDVMAELAKPWGPADDRPAIVLLVDDPAWADAEPDDIVAAARHDAHTFVLFVADPHTMGCDDHALLALDPRYDEEDPDPIDIASPRAFRILPAATHNVQANLADANLFFAEFARVAHADPDGVLRC
ncbi:DUF6924 domain-containing protein [Embleya scabrispora]|uniref:DUF6924 domain-containing protein n=1 Tax=Embleya scabrispora TaxID=159449 RepID=UPI00117F0C4D|nr:hypothetical protein [Embleya scabrispora]